MDQSPKSFTWKGSNEELAWVAGFLEGEGCFVLHKADRGKYAYARVRAYQVEKWPIDRLHQLLGGEMHLRAKRHPGHQRCWVWSLNTGATDLMKMLRPLMSPRRQDQID